MKRIRLHGIASVASAVGALMLLVTGCNTKEPKYEQATLDVDMSAWPTGNVEIDSTAQNVAFNVTTNRSWSVSIESVPAGGDITWINTSPAVGTMTDSKVLTISVAPNLTGAERSADVTVTAGSVQKTVTVIQSGGGTLGDVILTDDFGPGVASPGPYPYVADYTGWNKSGSGSGEVTYSGNGSSVRASNASSGYPGASGGGSIFFGGSGGGNSFAINKINVTGIQALTFTFGVSDASGTSSPYYVPVTSSSVTLQGSLDGTTWTNLTYTNASASSWVLATSEFKVPAGTTYLYIQIVANGPQMRVDDITIRGGGSGTIVIGGGGVTPPPTGETIYNETFGTTATGNPSLTASNAGLVTTGTGATNVTYAIASGAVSVRTTSASSGYTGASGGANAFFGALTSAMTVSGIDITGKSDFTLTFGAYDGSTGVNGKYPVPVIPSSIQVYGSTDGGTNWTQIPFTNAPDSSWVLATAPFSTTTGSTTLALKFSAAKASVIRVDDITLSAGGGSSTVVIGGGGTPPTSGLIAISALRAMGASLTTNGQTLTLTDNSYIEGSVVSDANATTGGNISANSLSLQDNTTAGSGINIYLSGLNVTQYAKGDKLKVVITGGKLTNYNGLLEFSPSAATQITDEGAGTAYAATAVTVAQLADYESMYVSIASCQVTDPLTKTMSGNTNMMTSDGTTFVMYTATGAAFASALVPQGSGMLKGISGMYNVRQVQPRDATDYAAMTSAPFLAWGAPVFSATKMDAGEAIVGGQITIPYSGATAGSVTVSVAATGAGSAGINAVTNQAITVAAGNGSIVIPITGTPTTAGAVTFTITGITGLTTNTATGTVAMAGSGTPFTASWSTTGLSNFGTSPFPATTKPANPTVGDLTKVGTWTTSGTAAANAWGGNDWTANLSTSTPVANMTNYATFTLTSTTVMSLTSINGATRASASGANHTAIFYQVGSGSFTQVADIANATAATAFAAVDLSAQAALQNIPAGTVITFKIVPYTTGTPTAPAASGTWYLMNAGTTNALTIAGSN